MSTLTYQPEAERYYAEGYWRSGDLWSDFAKRADENPAKIALVLDGRQVTYDELRRAAVGVSARLADQVPFVLAVRPDLVDELAAASPSADRVARHADDLAMVLHSSGTTSAPKGIAHSSNTLRYATEGVCRRWELTGEDVYLVVCE